MAKVTVNGYASPQEHIAALRAQGMTKKDAMVAERMAFLAEVRRRSVASGAAERVRVAFDAWLERDCGMTREQFNAMPAPKAWEGPIGKAAKRGRK